jgi:hypothetical protein
MFNNHTETSFTNSIPLVETYFVNDKNVAEKEKELIIFSSHLNHHIFILW